MTYFKREYQDRVFASSTSETDKLKKKWGTSLESTARAIEATHMQTLWQMSTIHAWKGMTVGEIKFFKAKFTFEIGYQMGTYEKMSEVYKSSEDLTAEYESNTFEYYADRDRNMAKKPDFEVIKVRIEPILNRFKALYKKTA